MNPLDKRIIKEIWKKNHKSDLDHNIIKYLITKLFMPLFLKLWDTEDLTLNLNTKISSQYILQKLIPSINKYNDLLDSMEEMGQIIIYNFFKNFKDDIHIEMIKNVVKNSDNDNFASLFKPYINSQDFFINNEPKSPNNNSILNEKLSVIKMRPKPKSPKIPLIPDEILQKI